jgi:ATP-dependent DNA ligase
LCGVGPNGITSFARIQAASDAGNGAGLVFFLFDLLHLDGDDLATRPLIERKQHLAALLPADGSPLRYSDHVIGQGPAFYDKACAMHVEGIVSKRVDAPYAPGNRGLWRKVVRNLPWSARPRSGNHQAPEITSTSAFLHL